MLNESTFSGVMTVDQVAKPHTELAVIVAAIQKLKAENKQLQSENHQLKVQTSSESAALQSANALVEQLQSDIEKGLDAAFHEQLRELDAENELLDSEKSKLQERLIAVEKQLSEAQKKISELTIQIKNLKSSTSYTADVQETIESLKKVLSE